jgi:hypothetical protein
MYATNLTGNLTKVFLSNIVGTACNIVKHLEVLREEKQALKLHPVQSGKKVLHT